MRRCVCVLLCLLLPLLQGVGVYRCHAEGHEDSAHEHTPHLHLDHLLGHEHDHDSDHDHDKLDLPDEPWAKPVTVANASRLTRQLGPVPAALTSVAHSQAEPTWYWPIPNWVGCSRTPVPVYLLTSSLLL